MKTFYSMSSALEESVLSKIIPVKLDPKYSYFLNNSDLSTEYSSPQSS